MKMPSFLRRKQQTRRYVTTTEQAPNAVKSHSLVPYDNLLGQSLDRMRALSRHLHHSSGIARSYLLANLRNVLGDKGLSLKTDNQQVADAWNDFTKGVNFDISEEHHFSEFAQLLLKSLIIDGEAVVRIYYDPDFKYGMKVRLLDAALLASKANGQMNGNRISLGVERNPVTHKVVAYHVSYENRPGAGNFLPLDYNADGRTQRIPAEDVLHILDKENTNSSRGVPALAPVLTDISQLSSYFEAETLAARANSKYLGVITQAEGTSGQYIPPDQQNQQNQNFDTANGAINTMPAGHDFKATNFGHPTQSFESFTRSIKENISSGGGLSYATVSGDVSRASFSSARVGLLADKSQFAITRALLVNRFYSPLFQKFVISAVQKGVLPMTPDMDSYMDVEWVGQVPENIQPERAAKATGDLIKLGVLSPSDAIRQMGKDPQAVMEESLRDRQTLSALYETEKTNGV